MKKSLTLVLATLLLCSCSNNPSKQTSEILSENTPNSSEVINASNPEVSVNESQSSTIVEKEFRNYNICFTYNKLFTSFGNSSNIQLLTDYKWYNTT